MTPAIKLAKTLKVMFTLHEYSHNSTVESYGLEAAEKLGFEAERIFKTLVVEIQNNQLGVAVIPVTQQMALKKVASEFNSKKASMAQPKDVQRSTGYVLGGVSPLGQNKQLPTVIDQSALRYASICVSAGKRGLEIELSPQDLANTCHAQFADICATEN